RLRARLAGGDALREGGEHLPQRHGLGPLPHRRAPRSRGPPRVPVTVHGDTSGLAPSETRVLERLYQRRVPFDVLTTNELTRDLVKVSHTTGRQVGVLVDRSGKITHVIVG